MNSLATTWPLRGRSDPRPSFAEVAEARVDDVRRYLLLLTRDAALADDLTSETFERAFRSWRRYDARRAAPTTWLCQIARSAALVFFRAEERRRRREERYAREHEETHEHSFGEGYSPELEQALASLSAAEREVVALRIVLDLDGETAARVLGISMTTCSTRLSRALKKLEERTKQDALA